EMAAERGPNLRELKAHLELLDEDVRLDRTAVEARVLLERGEDVAPERRLRRGLDLREVERDRGSCLPQHARVVHDVERDVDDGGGEAGAVGAADVPVVEVQPARTEDLRREVELRAPVGDGGPTEEALRPRVHLARDVFGDLHEQRTAADRQLQVPLVVE